MLRDPHAHARACNLVRAWLQVRVVKTRHLLRILEVIGLVFLVSACGHFFGWAAGTCKERSKEWEEEGYGLTWVPGRAGLRGGGGGGA